MTKVLFILSAVVMLVAAVFAYQNGQEFKKARNAAIAANRTVAAELKGLDEVEGKVRTAMGETESVQQEVNVEAEKIKSQKLRVAQADAEIKRVQDETADKDKMMAEMRLKLDKLPQGVKPETLVEDINTIKKKIGELEAEAELKKKDVVAVEEKVTAAQTALQDIQRKIEERRKSFDRNSLAARVVAVNNDWGFVVIDAGQTQGIGEATKLLVTRGTQTVGKLNIISVQGNRTVANILPDTLAQGMTIQPGDRVILENLYQ
ncbi:MAG TPA: hypothetical protein VD994_02010 [Prosthecobacter sp.]|nr:hypothetical protein [Prosthecobacter sp.]